MIAPVFVKIEVVLGHVERVVAPGETGVGGGRDCVGDTPVALGWLQP